MAGWFEGSEDHWRAQDWKLVYDGKSQAEIRHLWTRESYRDFVMVCDWRWSGETSKRQVPLILPDGSYAKNERRAPQ